MHARSAAVLLALANLVLLPGCGESPSGEGPLPSPIDDFPGWHARWKELAGRDFSVEEKQALWDQEGNKRPGARVTASSTWQANGHRVCRIDHPDIDDLIINFVNPRYAASVIAAKGQEDPVWSLRKFALPGEPDYELLSNSGFRVEIDANMQEFFQVPYRTVEMPREASGATVLHFDFDHANTEKIAWYPRTMRITFGGEQGMPVRYERETVGGMSWRVEFSGWKLLRQDVWAPVTKHAFQRAAGDAQEYDSLAQFTYHAVERDRTEECFLSYYGIEEPASTDWDVRLLPWLIAVSMILTGIALWKFAARLC